jgi:cytochrome c-type protein NapB
MNKRFLILLLMVVTITIVAFKSKTPEMPVTNHSTIISPDTNLITEEEIGYRHDDLYDEDALVLDDIEWGTAAPGTSTRIDRSFENAPPMIPHTVEGFVPIKANNNMCLTCHMPAVAGAMKSTSIPKSHFTNYRPEVKEKHGLYKVDAKEGDVVAKDMGDQLNKARYNCTQCHVVQAKVSVFIPNDFNPDFRSEGDSKSSNLNENIKEGVK